jgi:hypothetical protein
VPVPPHFTLPNSAIYDVDSSCSPGIDRTKGTWGNFHWTAASEIDFFTLSCRPHQIGYAANGTSGSGSFVSVGGFFEFGSACPTGACGVANLSGTFTWSRFAP